MTCQEVIDCLSKSKEWYIYGAGIIAYDIALALKNCYSLCPNGFLVSNSEDKYSSFITAETINSLDEKISKLSQNAVILIATPVVYHAEIEQLLKERKLENYIQLTNRLNYELMAEYHRKLGKFTLLEDMGGYTLTTERKEFDIGVYMAKCHVDKGLKKEYAIPDYVKPIQVGTQLTEKRIASFQDNIGINISHKNNNYSELTATYWVWKNTQHSYKGICHYRRMFELSELELKILRQQEIDAVLPLPYICRRTAAEQYSRYVSPRDFNGMLHALRDIDENIYQRAIRIFEERYLYNYNMLIAKREVFDEYCTWLFSILERAEYYCETEGKREDRYIGYLGELLTSFYFLNNQNNIKIGHASWNWMV